jgi:tRNA 5-methylaminomethyl-2-thiouridine biosynthesis bifunctional protein
LAGYPVRAAGCWFPRGAWVDTPELCSANLARHSQRVTQHFQRPALRLENSTEGWQVFGSDGARIAAAPVVVVANGFDCLTLEAMQGLPLHEVRGQLTYLPALPDRQLKLAISGNGYIAPLPDGGYCLGATFQHDDAQRTPRIEDHRENLTRLEALLPGFAGGLDATALRGRVAYRATTPDRLPIFGAIQPGLFVATGLGSRGLLWAPLGAELIAAQLEGEALPVEREFAGAVSPLRFSHNPHC